MENKIITRSLRRQLDQVVLHEQVENGVLNANQVDQWYETPRKVSQTKQKHLWIEKRPVNQKTPQVTLIIPHEVQTGETQKQSTIKFQEGRA